MTKLLTKLRLYPLFGFFVYNFVKSFLEDKLLNKKKGFLRDTSGKLHKKTRFLLI